MLTTTPPADLGLERHIIGAILLKPDSLPRIKKILQPGDFYNSQASTIFQAITECDNPDLPSLNVWLKFNLNGDAQATLRFAVEAIEGVSTTAGTEQHAATVLDLSRRRRLMAACIEASEHAQALTEPLESTMSGIKGALREIQADQQGDYDPPAKLIQDIYRGIEDRAASGNAMVGVPTGLDAIDRYIYGIERQTVTYIIARPSIGKTALALVIADYMASLGQGTVIFYSLEMSKQAITHRRLAALSNVFLSRIRKGALDPHHWDMLTKASGTIAQRPLIVIDRPRYKTVEHMVSMTETLAMEQPILAVFVDHIQYMASLQRHASRHLEISAISKAIRDMAKDLDVPVIVLCQLNRSPAQTNAPPELHHMKESGDLENDADLVIGLHRADKEDPVMQLAGLKGRDVGTWRSQVNFERFTQRITDPNGEG